MTATTGDVLDHIDRAVAGYTDRISYDPVVSDDAMRWTPDPELAPLVNEDPFTGGNYRRVSVVSARVVCQSVLIDDPVWVFRDAPDWPAPQNRPQPATRPHPNPVLRRVAADAVDEWAARPHGPDPEPVTVPAPSWPTAGSHRGYRVDRHDACPPAPAEPGVHWRSFRLVGTISAEVAGRSPAPAVAPRPLLDIWGLPLIADVDAVAFIFEAAQIVHRHRPSSFLLELLSQVGIA